MRRYRRPQFIPLESGKTPCRSKPIEENFVGMGLRRDIKGLVQKPHRGAQVHFASQRNQQEVPLQFRLYVHRRSGASHTARLPPLFRIC